MNEDMLLNSLYNAGGNSYVSRIYLRLFKETIMKNVFLKPTGDLQEAFMDFCSKIPESNVLLNWCVVSNDYMRLAFNTYDLDSYELKITNFEQFKQYIMRLKLAGVDI